MGVVMNGSVSSIVRCVRIVVAMEIMVLQYRDSATLAVLGGRVGSGMKVTDRLRMGGCGFSLFGEGKRMFARRRWSAVFDTHATYTSSCRPSLKV